MYTTTRPTSEAYPRAPLRTSRNMETTLKGAWAAITAMRSMLGPTRHSLVRANNVVR